MSDVQISPLAKRLAEENSIDWQRIKGTGPEGRVIERDILTYLARIMSGEADLPLEPDRSEPPPPAGVPDLGQVSNLAAASAGLAKEGVDLNALLAPPSNSSSFSNMPPLDLGAAGGFAPAAPAPTPPAFEVEPELVTNDEAMPSKHPTPSELVIEDLPAAPSFSAPSFSAPSVDAPTFTPPSFEPPVTQPVNEVASAFAPVNAFDAAPTSSADDDAVFELDLDDFEPEVVEEAASAPVAATAPAVPEVPVSAFDSAFPAVTEPVVEDALPVQEVHAHESEPDPVVAEAISEPKFESAFDPEPQLETNQEVFNAPLDLGTSEAVIDTKPTDVEPTYADIAQPAIEPEPVSAFQTVLQPIEPVFEDARAPEAFAPVVTEPVVEAVEMADEDIVVDLDEPEIASVSEPMPDLVAVQTEEPVLLQDDEVTSMPEPEPLAMEDAPLLIPVDEIAAPLAVAGVAGMAAATLHQGQDAHSSQHGNQHAGSPVAHDFFNLYAARRQFDAGPLSAISQQLSSAMNHQAVPLEVFLGRAASRAAHLLGSTSVCLARLESNGLQALDVGALNDGFVDAVKSVTQARPMQAQGLMVVNAASTGVDDLVLPAPNGVLALGRLHNGQATLTLSGQQPSRQSTEFLNKVAEYLENPVSLVI
jgi:hypothetical protein